MSHKSLQYIPQSTDLKKLSLKEKSIKLQKGKNYQPLSIIPLLEIKDSDDIYKSSFVIINVSIHKSQI